MQTVRDAFQQLGHADALLMLSKEHLPIPPASMEFEDDAFAVHYPATSAATDMDGRFTDPALSAIAGSLASLALNGFASRARREAQVLEVTLLRSVSNELFVRAWRDENSSGVGVAEGRDVQGALVVRATLRRADAPLASA